MVDVSWHKPGITRYIPKNAFETQLINSFHSHIIQGTWGKFDEGNMVKRPKYCNNRHEGQKMKHMGKTDQCMFVVTNST
jgi:hypothetical protein